MRRLLKFLKNERGASAVEYGLLVALIAAVIVGALRFWEEIYSKLSIMLLLSCLSLKFPSQNRSGAGGTHLQK